MNRKEMKEGMEVYLANAKASGCAETTVTNYNRAIKKFLAFLEQRNKAEDEQIKTVDIANFKISLAEAGLKQSTIRAYLEVLSLFFSFCKDSGIIEENPCKASVTKTKVPAKKGYKNLLTRQEIEKLLVAERPDGATRKTWPRTFAMVAVLITSGCRNSELREIKLGDVDFESGTILIRSGKGGVERRCAFPKAAREAVRRYLQSDCVPKGLKDDDYLFGKGETPDDWKQFGREELTSLVERYVKIATGRSGIRTHALRHSSASLLWDSGVSSDDISELLGHSSVATTKIYLDRLRPEQPTQEAERVFQGFA